MSVRDLTQKLTLSMLKQSFLKKYQRHFVVLLCEYLKSTKTFCKAELFLVTRFPSSTTISSSGGWVGGKMNWRIRLTSAKVGARVEVEAELGNNLSFYAKYFEISSNWLNCSDFPRNSKLNSFSHPFYLMKFESSIVLSFLLTCFPQHLFMKKKTLL